MGTPWWTGRRPFRHCASGRLTTTLGATARLSTCGYYFTCTTPMVTEDNVWWGWARSYLRGGSSSGTSGGLSPIIPVEAQPLSTSVEARPPYIPLEVDPPLSSSGGGSVKGEAQPSGDAEVPTSTSWGEKFWGKLGWGVKKWLAGAQKRQYL